jgi:hypothetical protein
MIASILLITFLLTAVYQSPWAWIGVALVVLWKWRKWYRYNGRPWRKVHFNAMIFAAAALAREQIRSKQSNQEFDFKKMYEDILNCLGGIGFTISGDVGIFIENCLNGEFLEDNKALALQYMVYKKNINAADALGRINNLYVKIDLNDNYFKLRSLVAGVIQSQYTLDDKGEYWFEVLNNNAP